MHLYFQLQVHGQLPHFVGPVGTLWKYGRVARQHEHGQMQEYDPGFQQVQI